MTLAKKPIGNLTAPSPSFGQPAVIRATMLPRPLSASAISTPEALYPGEISAGSLTLGILAPTPALPRLWGREVDGPSESPPPQAGEGSGGGQFSVLLRKSTRRACMGAVFGWASSE